MTDGRSSATQAPRISSGARLRLPKRHESSSWRIGIRDTRSRKPSSGPAYCNGGPGAGLAILTSVVADSAGRVLALASFADLRPCASLAVADRRKPRFSTAFGAYLNAWRGFQSPGFSVQPAEIHAPPAGIWRHPAAIIRSIRRRQLGASICAERTRGERSTWRRSIFCRSFRRLE